MAEAKQGPKGWTPEEKVGLLFNIIAAQGPIPWDSIPLPEGRTIKACQVMVDKEKTKIKKSREEAGLPPLEATPRGKKRKADGAETPAPARSAKKAKGGKKKKEAEEEGEEDDQGAKEGGENESKVKAEEKDGEEE